MNLDLPNFASIKGGMKLVRSAKIFYVYSTVINEGYIPQRKKRGISIKFPNIKPIYSYPHHQKDAGLRAICLF